jgi:hypothetical protein
MEIRILFYGLTIWFALNLIGLGLMFFRTDAEKYRKEADFILSKGTFAHKLTFVAMTWLILPFTIPYSIKNILNKNK